MTIELVSCGIHGEFEIDTSVLTIDARQCPWERGNPLQGRRYVGRSAGRCYGDLEFIREKRWARDIHASIVHDRAVVCPVLGVADNRFSYPQDEEVKRKVANGEWTFCTSCHGYPELTRPEMADV